MKSMLPLLLATNRWPAPSTVPLSKLAPETDRSLTTWKVAGLTWVTWVPPNSIRSPVKGSKVMPWAAITPDMWRVVLKVVRSIVPTLPLPWVPPLV